MRADHGRDCDDTAAFHRVSSVFLVMIGIGKRRRVSLRSGSAVPPSVGQLREQPMTRMRRRLLGLVGSMIAVAAAPQPASAQNYPTRTVRVIVPAAPGGPSDIMARLIAQKLAETWGQQFIVENMPTGAGNVGVA